MEFVFYNGFGTTSSIVSVILVILLIYYGYKVCDTKWLQHGGSKIIPHLRNTLSDELHTL